MTLDGLAQRLLAAWNERRNLRQGDLNAICLYAFNHGLAVWQARDAVVERAKQLQEKAA